MNPTGVKRVGIVGPLLGGNPGWTISPGEQLAPLLSRAGYHVATTSKYPHPARRVFDTAATILRWGRDIDVLVVLVFSGRSFAIAELSARLGRLRRRPIVLALHGGNLPTFAVAHPRRVTRLLDQAEAVVTPSSFLEREFKARGYPVRVIPNVVDIKGYPFRQRKSASPRILWMRTFQDMYQPHLAIETLHLLRKTHPTATLTMAGQDRGLLAETRARAEALRLADAVRFAGFLDTKDKQREFAANDIYLNTTKVDNAPVTLVEAGAFGVPIVTTSAGGIPDLVAEGETALFGSSASDLAGCVARLVADPTLVQKLSLNGRKLAESHSESTVAPMWDNLLAAIV